MRRGIAACAGIRAWVENRDRPPVRFVMLDFEQVTGIDSSAAYAFHRMRQEAKKDGFILLLTGPSQEQEAQLELAEHEEANGHLRTFVDLKHGIEWCEEQLLSEARRGGARSAPTMLERLEQTFPDTATSRAFAAFQSEQSFDAGEELIAQGDAAGDMYFLEAGEVSVYVTSPDGGRIRVRRTGGGAVLGEIGFYLGTPRSAAVVADTSGCAYRLTAEALRNMEQERPEFASALHRFMADLLAERLLHTLRPWRQCSNSSLPQVHAMPDQTTVAIAGVPHAAMQSTASGDAPCRPRRTRRCLESASKSGSQTHGKPRVKRPCARDRRTTNPVSRMAAVSSTVGV